MPEFKRLTEDISALHEEAQQLAIDFVTFLKQRYQQAQLINRLFLLRKWHRASKFALKPFWWRSIGVLLK